MAWASAYSAQVLVDALVITSTAAQPVERGALVLIFLWIIFAATLFLAVLAQAFLFPEILPDTDWRKFHSSEPR